MSTTNTLHVLVAECNYDQGVVGVFTSEELALAAAEEIWPTTDGHHNFRIDQRQLNVPKPDVFMRTYFAMTRLTTKPMKWRRESERQP